jgi:3-hydroxyacyl-[acyl-carrier-protein] dehydratase
MFPAVTSLIPHRPPFLFVDEIVSVAPGVLVARHTWRKEQAFYEGHYPGAPITPGVLLCESVVQTGALLVSLGQSGPDGAKPGEGPIGVPILAKINDVRFRQSVFPGDTTVMEVKLKEWLAGFGMMAGTMKCGERRILTIEFTVTLKDPAAVPTGSSPA